MTLHKPLYLQGTSYDAPDDRGIFALFGTPGVRSASELLGSVRAAGANMSVDVAAGRGVVANATMSRGAWGCFNDAPVNVSIDASSGSGDRTDLVVLQVNDADSGAGDGASNNAAFVVLKGTVGGGVPTIAATLDAIPICEVPVPKNAISVTAVRDRRLMMDYPSVPGRFLQGATGTAASPDLISGIKRFSGGLQVGSGRVIGTQYAEVPLGGTTDLSVPLNAWTDLPFDSFYQHSDDVDGALYNILGGHFAQFNGPGVYSMTLVASWNTNAGVTASGSRAVRLITGAGSVIGQMIQPISDFGFERPIQTLTVCKYVPGNASGYAIHAQVLQNQGTGVNVMRNGGGNPTYLSICRLA